MQTMQSVLLHGDYAWRRDLVPIAEFEARLTATRELMRQQQWDGLVVHGDSRENAALCYLTNFVPNQRWCLALIGKKEPIRVIASVGPRDLPAVRPLTWVEDVRAAGNVKTPLSEWLTELCGATGRAGGSARIGVVDLARMRADIGRGVEEVCRSFGSLQDASELLRNLRQAKSPAEIGLIRQSYRILQMGLQEVELRRQSGWDIARAVLAGKLIARRAGAQDVRALCSAQGCAELRPVDATLQDASLEPWTIYLAVRHCGYWTDAVTTLASDVSDVAHAVRAGLRQALDVARPGVTCRQVAAAIRPSLAKFALHPVFGSKVCRANGLSLDAEPWMAADSAEGLVDNASFTVVAGAGENGGGHVLESTTVILEGSRRTVLHPMTEPQR